MKKTGLHVEGFDDADDALAAIGAAPANPDRVMPAMLDALQPVAERAKEIVPVQTGRLRDDIDVSDRADGAGEGGLAAYVGPSVDAFYAEDVEFGRPASISRSGREWDAVEAEPYMRPAWDAEQDGVLPRLGKGLGRVLSAAAKG